MCYQSSGYHKLEGLPGRTETIEVAELMRPPICLGQEGFVYHEAVGFYLFSFAARKTVNRSKRGNAHQVLSAVRSDLHDQVAQPKALRRMPGDRGL
jgi:hypothetical protein